MKSQAVLFETYENRQQIMHFPISTILCVFQLSKEIFNSIVDCVYDCN